MVFVERYSATQFGEFGLDVVHGSDQSALLEGRYASTRSRSVLLDPVAMWTDQDRVETETVRAPVVG